MRQTDENVTLNPQARVSRLRDVEYRELWSLTGALEDNVTHLSLVWEVKSACVKINKDPGIKEEKFVCLRKIAWEHFLSRKVRRSEYLYWTFTYTLEAVFASVIIEMFRNDVTPSVTDTLLWSSRWSEWIQFSTGITPLSQRHYLQ